MSPIGVWLLVLVGIGAGFVVGWILRAVAVPATEDPEGVILALRDAHGGCGAKLRNLHIELAQLETKLVVIGAEPRQRVSVGGEEPPTTASLASLIGALESGSESITRQPSSHGDEDEGRPAAFMSILPADRVEQSVREVPPDSVGDEVRMGIGERLTISLVDQSDKEPALQIELPSDDLTVINGIGPKTQEILHAAGITNLNQLANLGESEIIAVGTQLGATRERRLRDDWITTAQNLLEEPANR